MTEAEGEAWGRHWARIKRLFDEGRVVVVGPTLGRINTGLCVFEAPDEAAATAFMNEDPAIAGGFARGELRPMRVSLLRGRDEAWIRAEMEAAASDTKARGPAGPRAGARTRSRKRARDPRCGRQVLDPDVLVGRVGVGSRRGPRRATCIGTRWPRRPGTSAPSRPSTRREGGLGRSRPGGPTPRPGPRGDRAASTRRARPRAARSRRPRTRARRGAGGRAPMHLDGPAGPARSGCRGGRARRPGSRSWACGLGVARPQALEIERRSAKVTPSFAASPSSAGDESLDPSRARMSSSSCWSMRRRSPRAGPAWADACPASSPCDRRAGRLRPRTSPAPRRAAGPRWAAATARLECASWAHGPHVELEDDDALAAAETWGRSRRSSPPPSISAASASRSRGRRSSRASRAPLPVSSWPSTRNRTRHGSGPIASSQASTRPDARQELALVVRRATRPDAAVADGRLVRRRGPQLERARGLDVVVLDGAHRPRAVADLADDQRRGAVESRGSPRSPRGAEAARRSSPRPRAGRACRRPRTRSRRYSISSPVQRSSRSSTTRSNAAKSAGLGASRPLAVEVEERELDDRRVHPATPALDRPLDLQPRPDALELRAARRPARSPA